METRHGYRLAPAFSGENREDNRYPRSSAQPLAKPLHDPAYPKPPYKFYNREFATINYRTDPEVLRALVPEALDVIGDTVSLEFIRMPGSAGFGDYTETGKVIPVRFATRLGEALQFFQHAMCDVARLPVREAISASPILLLGFVKRRLIILPRTSF